MKKRSSKKQRTDTSLLEGVIDVTARGVGYVNTPRYTDDIEIAPEYLNTALNGDTVSIRLLPHGTRRRRAGMVVRVHTRAKTQFVGTLKKEGDEWFLVPDDRRMYANILIPHPKKNPLQHTKALVRLRKWSDPSKNPEGEITVLLGNAGKHDTEMKAIVLERGFDLSFSTEVLKEARHAAQKYDITEKEIQKRADFRDVPTVTIDPEDAKDFDDALSIRTLPNGEYEVGVHIADVSHFVRPRSVLDREARERGTSVYLVDRTIPMLPDVLSNDACSLNEGEDKLTFSALFIITKDGSVRRRTFKKTVIRSRKRLTYEEAQRAIEHTEHRFHTELKALNTLARHMRKKRIKEGAIDFDQDEIGFKLDKNGVPLSIFKKKRLPAHELVEEWMLLANREVAEHIHRLSRATPQKPFAFIWRIHDVPKQEKLEELSVFLRALGYEFKMTGGTISGTDLNKLFASIKGKPEESLITIATIRSMAKAVYTTKNIGHFGLSFKYYTHFTSPIRRYPDLVVHRLLAHHLDKTLLSQKELMQYERTAIHASQREIAAVAAERESIKYKQVEYMERHIGKTFDGIISGVTSWGAYVEEKETRAEGLVRVGSMKDDFYTFDKSRFALVGTRSKKTYRLGDSVTIKLVAADRAAKTLDYIFV